MAKNNLAALTEESVMVISIFRWILLATIIGIVVGGGTTGFLYLLHHSIDATKEINHYYFLLPIAMFLSSLVSKYLAPSSEGHGTERVIEAVHKNKGKINALVIPVKALTTIMTIATGGSVGKEGPSAQIGAGLAAQVSDLFRFSAEERKKLVICGISAGFAAVFGTPIAGALFGVEVLIVGNILYQVLLPSFVAGMVSYQVAATLGMTYNYFPITFDTDFSIPFYLQVVLAGIFFGLCSLLFITVMKKGKKISKKIKIWEPLKGLIGGSIVVVAALIFGTEYLGLGLDTIHDGLTGKHIIWYAFILKTILTSITLNFGGSGGIVTPVFLVGVASGQVFALAMGLPLEVFAAIGLVALLAGTTNTPIASSIMAVELFGPDIVPYATVACVISFLMVGNRSAYPTQLLAMNKAPSMAYDLGKNIESGETRFEFGVRRRMVKGLRFTKFRQKKDRKKP